MAKKTTKTSKRSAPTKTTRKPGAKPGSARKASKKTTRTSRKTTGKAAAKKAAKKPAPKPAQKKTTRKTTGKAAKKTKPATEKTATSKAAAKKTARKTAKTAQKPAEKTTRPASKAKPTKDAPPPAAAPASPGDKRGGRQGITIVSKKVTRRAGKSKTVMPTFGAGLGQMKRKPLIPSGPKNVLSPDAPAASKTPDSDVKATRSPFNKRELAKFKKILIAKRLELIGDVSEMEREALLSGTGGLSHTPSHMAEQGSDAYDQSLSLDLAAVDRKLIKEIDDALGRIEAGTYGLCELTGRPIRPERLEELPWARHSIDAARELERRSMRL